MLSTTQRKAPSAAVLISQPRWSGVACGAPGGLGVVACANTAAGSEKSAVIEKNTAGARGFDIVISSQWSRGVVFAERMPAVSTAARHVERSSSSGTGGNARLWA